MKWIFAMGLVAMVGCSDESPTGNHPITLQESSTALVESPAAPLLDAMDRIVPAYQNGAAAGELKSALAALLVNQNSKALAKLETALARLVAEYPDAVADADAIRLAVAGS